MKKYKNTELEGLKNIVFSPNFRDFLQEVLKFNIIPLNTLTLKVMVIIGSKNI